MSKDPSQNSTEEAGEDCVYLVTGELVGFSSQRVLAVGYVIADSPSEAAQEQVKAQPNMRVSGVVSLAELRDQVRRLESARSGRAPVLRCGRHKISG